MKLDKKKDLAVRTLNVGRARILFNTSRLDEIKEAITKQDIRDLLKSKAIMIKEITGKRKQTKNKRRRAGSIKKKVNTRKRDYMIITRKLRAYIFELKKHGTINPEEYWKLRKEIRARQFKSKAHMKERIQGIISERENNK
ncbi:MAG: 50S ribosomal protein L19e [Candidatus Pacearchaeota archaeon]|nr:50S ribosomal protein L19e [Candidatus Pacearchaeota archaeon]